MNFKDNLLFFFCIFPVFVFKSNFNKAEIISIFSIFIILILLNIFFLSFIKKRKYIKIFYSSSILVFGFDNHLGLFNGIIQSSYVEEGDYIRPGDIIANIVDLNPIKIQGYLSEFDVNKVKLGTKATIENANGIKKEGIISFISPSAETSTRTFEITIEANVEPVKKNNDPNFQFEGFYEELRKRGYIIYPGKLTVCDSFRIGCIGHIFEDQILGLLDAIRDTLGVMNVSNCGP